MMWGAEQRKNKQFADDEAEQWRLHAQDGSVHPIRVSVAAGECAGRAGPGAGAGAEESHCEGRKLLPDQAGGEHNQIQPEVQVLHHDEAAEPALLPGGGGEGDAAQLQDHAGGAAGPAVEGGGEARAAGPGGREDAAGAAGHGEREAAQGDGGPHHRRPMQSGDLCSLERVGLRTVRAVETVNYSSLPVRPLNCSVRGPKQSASLHSFVLHPQ